jgi:hypothetical protein
VKIRFFIVYNKEIADLIEKIHITAAELANFDMLDLATKQLAMEQ